MEAPTMPAPSGLSVLQRLEMQAGLRSMICEALSLCSSNSVCFFISSLFGRGYYRSTAAESLRNGRAIWHTSIGLTGPAYFDNRSRLRAPARF